MKLSISHLFGKKIHALEDSNFKFLVIGAGRGGTSLLSALLDKHDDIEVGFELFSIDYLMGEKISVAGKNIYGTRVHAFIDACIEEARRFPNKLWGNKITTEQLYGLEDHNRHNPPDNRINIFDNFFNISLQGVKIIFILRDGRTCIRSKMKRTGQSLEIACNRWLYSVSVYKFLKTIHKNNFLIKFEDLLTRPQETLFTICQFLDVEYQENMLAGVNNLKTLPEYRQKHFDISKLNLDGIPVGCIEKIRDGLRYCDYV